MPSLRKMFSTPKKAAVSIACLVVILVTLGICIAMVYAGSGGQTAENSAIGSENAQKFAFADAGIDPVSAQAVQVKYSRFQDGFVYEVEFVAGDTEYEYKINAEDGSVVKKEQKTVAGPEDSGALPPTVTLERARETALADAGITREEATFTEVEQDLDGGVSVYEFKFYAGNMEYEYEISAQTGEVYSKKTTTYVGQSVGGATRPSLSPAPAKPDATPAPVQPTPAPTQSPVTAAPQPTSQPTQPGGRLYIGVDSARAAALSDAGLSADQVRFTQVHMDYEGGVAVYELEFFTSTHEYEYKINAQTGAVYSRSVDAVSTFSGAHHPEQHNSGANCISADAARSAALRHAGCAADQVVFTKTELASDGGAAIYEIEFYHDGVEYELELDAATGAVLNYSAEPAA